MLCISGPVFFHSASINQPQDSRSAGTIGLQTVAMTALKRRQLEELILLLEYRNSEHERTAKI
jgi:hypothetical protein